MFNFANTYLIAVVISVLVLMIIELLIEGKVKKGKKKK